MVCPKCGTENVLLDPARQDGAGELGGPRSLALEAGRRLKDTSVYLLGFAYLMLLLALGAGTAVMALASELPAIWRAFAFMGSTLTGLFLFIFLKFLSDVVQALADLTDLGRSLENRLALIQEAPLTLSPTPPAEAAKEAVEA